MTHPVDIRKGLVAYQVLDEVEHQDDLPIVVATEPFALASVVGLLGIFPAVGAFAPFPLLVVDSFWEKDFPELDNFRFDVLGLKSLLISPSWAMSERSDIKRIL